MLQKLLTYFFLICVSFGFSQTVVINEIDADTPGSDVLEFIELKSFDAGGIALPSFALDGYVLVFYRASTNTIYRTIDLDGLVTDINGIIHLGNSQVSPTPPFIFPSNGLQNASCVAALYLGNDADFPIDTATFKILKRALPGPYTFILPGSTNLPKEFKKKTTVGIRVPDNSIALEIVRQLGNPIVSTSIHDEDEVIEYTTDPELIFEKWQNLVDMVIDGGYGDNTASTIIDLSGHEPIVIREGKGDLDIL